MTLKKSKHPHTQSTRDLVQSGLANRAAIRQTDSVPQLSRTLENWTGKLAMKHESGSNSNAVAPSTFVRDFTQVPAHSQAQTTVSGKATDADSKILGPFDCPPGKTWVAGKHIPPKFIPTTNVSPTRSYNSSITIPEKVPQVPGTLAVDCKNKVWRYQLDQFVSLVDMNIYYYPEDHYPAPQPTDDSGKLTNVTKGNCKAMVEELYRDRTKVHKNWSAYKRDHLHENYHYEVEWQNALNKFVPKFETEIEQFQVPFTDPYLPFIPPPTAEEAEEILKAKVEAKHDSEYSKVWHDWDRIPDTEGAGAYLAQVPAIEHIIDRVVRYGKRMKWLPADYTPGTGVLPSNPEKGAKKQKEERKDPQPTKQ